MWSRKTVLLYLLQGQDILGYIIILWRIEDFPALLHKIRKKRNVNMLLVVPKERRLNVWKVHLDSNVLRRHGARIGANVGSNDLAQPTIGRVKM